MPYNGPSSFLPDESAYLSKSAEAMCQCPITGHHHFYVDDAVDGITHGGCQCPITGHHHFYASALNCCQRVVCGCQCPITGHHHFYRLYHDEAHVDKRVSMPYNGPSSFLHKDGTYRRFDLSWCQCPITGHHHFYNKYEELSAKDKKCVNAL